jgi:DNA polymerase III gamma/tau subunit
MVDHLRLIAGKEKVVIEDAALYAIARGADGGMRDAESALDQLISFCGEKIVEADVLSMFGLTSQSQLLSLSNGLLKGEVQTVLAELSELAKHGKDLGKFLGDLLQHLLRQRLRRAQARRQRADHGFAERPLVIGGKKPHQLEPVGRQARRVVAHCGN